MLNIVNAITFIILEVLITLEIQRLGTALGVESSPPLIDLSDNWGGAALYTGRYYNCVVQFIQS